MIASAAIPLMKKIWIPLALAALAVAHLPLCAGEETPPPIMGRWQGKVINPTKEHGYLQTHPDLCAEVIALGGDKYHVRLLPHFFRRAHVFAEFDASATNGILRFNEGGWKGEITPSSFTGEAFADGKTPLKFSLSKSGFASPTLGMKPPEGAKVLFDGKNLDAWQKARSEGDAQWQVLENGAFEVIPKNKNAGAGGPIRTRDQFGDVHLHVEFRLPYEPELQGQNRGNSGIFLQGLYEVQVLDSFGLEGLWNECGAIYHTAPPKVNACLPPGEWQTYDILFRAARLNPDGSVVEYPRITIRQNGILVQYNEELRESTLVVTSTQKPLPVRTTGPVELQDHGHPVQYRNIWAAPLQDAAGDLTKVSTSH